LRQSITMDINQQQQNITMREMMNFVTEGDWHNSNKSTCWAHAMCTGYNNTWVWWVALTASIAANNSNSQNWSPLLSKIAHFHCLACSCANSSSSPIEHSVSLLLFSVLSTLLVTVRSSVASPTTQLLIVSTPASTLQLSVSTWCPLWSNTFSMVDISCSCLFLWVLQF